jgi:HD-GYP domain-containing protein (c-di-GMP phosphodiesterase class II)
MVIGKNIIDGEGRVLLTAGQTLTIKYVQRIQSLDIDYVYIQDDLDIEDPAPPVRPATFSRATASFKKCYDQCVQTGKVNLRAMQSQVDNIINDLMNNSTIMYGLAEVKEYDDYTYEHSVNVCVLSLILGISQDYSKYQLQSLGIGSMLHDIGKIKIPLEIINKPSRLTYDEIIEIKKHPLTGYQLATESNDLPRGAGQAIMQHHEYVNGRGYPRGIDEPSIHEYGLIVAVADVFDALITDRPYRRGFSNYEAMQIMQQETGTHLSKRFVDALLRHVNLYPPGTVVSLTNGDLALVTQENPADRNRPRLKLLFDINKKAYESNSIMDLTEHKDIFVDKVFSTEEGEVHLVHFMKANNKSV